jgi:hypothetical protein
MRHYSDVAGLVVLALSSAAFAQHQGDIWTLEMIGKTVSPKGEVVIRSAFELCFCKKEAFAVRGIRQDDFTQAGKQGEITWVSPTVRKVVETLEVERIGETIHFREIWPATEIQVVLRDNRTGRETTTPPITTPGGDHVFEMPLRDGATLDWDGTSKSIPKFPPGFSNAYRFTLRARTDRDAKANKIDLEIHPDVAVVTQTKKNDCWLAAALMMLGWKEHKSLHPSEALGRVDPKFKRIYERDTSGLVSAEMAQLSKELGFRPEPPASYPLDLLVDWLKGGPLQMIVEDRAGQGLHAVVVIGACGDGTAERTTITYIDPIEGKTSQVPYGEFLKGYEAAGHDTAQVRVVHF